MMVKLRAGEREVHLESEGDLSETIEKAFEALARLEGHTAKKIAPIGRQEPSEGADLDLSINAIVSRLGSGSARAILKAAATYISLVEGKVTFSRDELSLKAREARDWHASYNTNQSRDLKRMIGAREIVEKAGGNFSLPTKVLEESRRILIDE